jgi:short-subunit dehydrogenase
MSLVAGRVLITGATGGIGLAIARAFADRGASLVISGRRSEILDPLAAEVGGRAVRTDLAQRPDLERLVAEAGDVDVLVANAALPASGVLTELSQEQIDRMLEINLRAPIALARAIAPQMIDRGSGHMVFISSLAGKAAAPASSIYSATKFGLRGFALGLREDLRHHGVGVSVVLPGFISDAGMFAEANVELPRGVGTRTPEQVAGAVVQAVERDRAEIEVAPLGLRLGANFASVAPAVAASVQRKIGGGRVASDLAAGQSDKR